MGNVGRLTTKKKIKSSYKNFKRKAPKSLCVGLCYYWIIEIDLWQSVLVKSGDINTKDSYQDQLARFSHRQQWERKGESRMAEQRQGWERTDSYNGLFLSSLKATVEMCCEWISLCFLSSMQLFLICLLLIYFT